MDVIESVFGLKTAVLPTSIWHSQVFGFVETLRLVLAPGLNVTLHLLHGI
jgi:hypothetical protein